eukprot:197390-Rhodomonas_salina.1
MPRMPYATSRLRCASPHCGVSRQPTPLSHLDQRARRPGELRYLPTRYEMPGADVTGGANRNGRGNWT